MKDNLFELLISLFEKSLTQIQKSTKALDQDPLELLNEEEFIDTEEQALYIQSAHQYSTRVFTYEEQMKLTKPSYQFLMRMKAWGIVDNEYFETIMNQLLISDSRIINLQETKWTIRNVLASSFSEEQLAFLDLVLYQAEDQLTIH